MKTKLTKTKVEALELPASGQTFVWDSELTGFGVKLTPTGRTYVAERRVNGKTRRVTIGKHGILTTDQARKTAISALAEMVGGVDITARKRADKASSVTLAELVALYAEAKAKTLRPATLADFTKHLSRNFADWRELPIVEITRDMVSARHLEISKRSPAQANLALRYLRAWINWGMAKFQPNGEPIIARNPVEALASNQLDQWNTVAPRKNRIPADKVGAAWNLLQEMRTTQVNGTAADFVCFLLLTGCRWREGAQLTWDRVDLDAKWLYLPDPKNRQPVKLPLSDALVEILKDRQKADGYVFPGRIREGHISRAWAPLKRISEISGQVISHHDLRRTFVNIAWKEVGVGLLPAQLLTNHRTKDVTINSYGDPENLLFLRPETNKISEWIVEQGRITATK